MGGALLPLPVRLHDVVLNLAQENCNLFSASSVGMVEAPETRLRMRPFTSFLSFHSLIFHSFDAIQSETLKVFSSHKQINRYIHIC
jgi:hypothetical protein